MKQNQDTIHETLERLQNEAETRAASGSIAGARAPAPLPAQDADYATRSDPLIRWPSRVFGRRQVLFCAPDGVHYRWWCGKHERVIAWQDVAGAFIDSADTELAPIYGIRIRQTGRTGSVGVGMSFGEHTAEVAVDTIGASRKRYDPREPGDGSWAAWRPS